MELRNRNRSRGQGVLRRRGDQVKPADARALAMKTKSKALMAKTVTKAEAEPKAAKAETFVLAVVLEAVAGTWAKVLEVAHKGTNLKSKTGSCQNRGQESQETEKTKKNHKKHKIKQILTLDKCLL